MVWLIDHSYLDWLHPVVGKSHNDSFTPKTGTVPRHPTTPIMRRSFLHPGCNKSFREIFQSQRGLRSSLKVWNPHLFNLVDTHTHGNAILRKPAPFCADVFHPVKNYHYRQWFPIAITRLRVISLWEDNKGSAENAYPWTTF